MASPPSDDSPPPRPQEDAVREEPSLARRLFTVTGPPPPVEPLPPQVQAPPVEPFLPAPPDEITGPPPSVLPVSARIARISMQPATFTGPPPPVLPFSEEIARISGDAKPQPKKPAPPRLEPFTGPPPAPEPDESVPELRPTKPPGTATKPPGAVTRPPPPPPRRQTMEVQMAWLEVRDEPRVEVATPVASDVAPDVPAASTDGAHEGRFDSEAPTALRRRPPRVPGALRTLPPMPLSNVPTKPPPPPRRHTQEVEMSWVELVDDDLVEDSSSGDSGSLPSVDVALSSGSLPKFPEVESVPVFESSPALESKPVLESKSVVESKPVLPKLFDESEPREVTRVESVPVSTQRIEQEKAVALASQRSELEGPPISDTIREARIQEAQQTAKRPPLDEAKLAAELANEVAATAARKERLSQFLQATSASVPPGALRVSDITSAEATDADLDKMRDEGLAARKREQDARDREILQKRRAERQRERLEEEAKQARRDQEKREEEERATAMRQGSQDKQLLDLSDIDDEIDNALDAVLGPNLSYPPPPPPPGEDEK